MIPSSTYRLQLHAGFTFDDAGALLGYLDDLGAGCVYLSPILAARPGSTHGYDVVDPTVVDDERGGEEAFVRLASAARERGLGVLVDIVPNHMAASDHNPWWVDVLRLGPRSRYARVFDIDFAAPGAEGRVLLPVLGEPYGDAVRSGKLTVRTGGDDPCVVYAGGPTFPLDPATVPARAPRSHDRIHDLLERQSYRLAWWRTASSQINYRRFFDVTDLVGVRVEDEEVFELTHAKILELCDRGLVTGLRVDHVDGLYDPAAYLRRLSDRAGDVHLVVEKILAPGERLPAGWPVDGTTGYEFLRDAGGLLVDPAGAARIDELWPAGDVSFDHLATQAKREALTALFGSELRALAARLEEFARVDRSARDLDPRDLEAALATLTVTLTPYRTYLDATGPPSAADRATIRRASAAASQDARDGERRAVAFLTRVLLGDDPAPGARRAWRAFAMRWQQLTGPVTAKGVEDTALYRDTRLVCRNDVGMDPGEPPAGPGTFHRAAEQRRRSHPGSLTATSTHDTKRSEDVRARLAVLSQILGEWSRTVDRWEARYAHQAADDDPPGFADRLLAYQTAVGIFDDGCADAARIETYMLKAVREAKVRTSWTDPDDDYERALRTWISSVARDPAFVKEMAALDATVALHGALGSLSAVVWKIASPGVPDVYQGNELWDLSLVDPDNRRPVDYAARREALRDLDDADAAQALGTWRDARIKLLVTARALRARRAQPELFARGRYLPLEASGTHGGRVVAFARARGRRWAVAAGTRLMATGSGDRLPDAAAWGNAAITLPDGAPRTWKDELSGAVVRTDGRVTLRELFAALPVALLTSG